MGGDQKFSHFGGGGGMQCFVHKIYGGMSRLFLQFCGVGPCLVNKFQFESD